MRSRRFYCSLALNTLSAAVLSAAAEAQTVASIDFGSNAAINRAPGEYDFVRNDAVADDESSDEHGTIASLIINDAAGGVPIVPLKVRTGDHSTTQAWTDAALSAAASNPSVRVIAYSAGSDSPSGAMATAASAGKFIAIYAGNSGASSPNGVSQASAGLPGVVIVGATDSAGNPVASSNRAGSTASRYVMTDGTTSYTSVYGTSFAASRMAGIASAVLHATPGLSSESLAQVIFAAATPIAGDWGHGYVKDAAQVINNPAGPVSVASDGGGGGGGAGVAAVVLGAAAGLAIWKGGKKDLESTLVFDPYGRPFIMDLSEAVSIARSGPNIGRFTQMMDEVQNAEQFSLSDRLQARLSYSFTSYQQEQFEIARHLALPDDPAFNYRNLNWTFALNGKLPGDVDLQLNKNTDPGDSLGAINAIPYSQDFGHARFLSGQSFSTPYLGFASAADSVIVKFAPAQNWETRFAYVDTDTGESYAHADSEAAFIEGAYNVADHGRVGVQFGRFHETGSLFGGSSGGALSVDTNSTYALNFTGSAAVTRSFSLVGNYGLGFSDAQEASGSMLKDFSSLRTNWYGLGLIGNGLLKAGDQVGFAVSQPLRVSGGEATLSVPYALDADGGIARTSSRLSMVPEGRETALEAYYARPLDRNSSIGVFLLSRFEPEHDAEASNEFTAFATYRLRF